MRNKVLLFIFVMSLFLYGCQKSTTTQYLFKEGQINKKEDTNTSITNEFDFGTYSYNKDKENTSYRLKGVVSFPKKEGKYPLILIVHGSHENTKKVERLDKGFKYLSEKLANNSFVAVSIDFSEAYNYRHGNISDKEKIIDMVNKYLEVIDNKKSSDDFRISDRINFEKIGLIGHSKGGEIVFNIADNLKNTDKKISSILSVSPTNSIEDTKLLTTDIKTSILVSELDGEVIGLDGYSIYDKLKSKKRENTVSITILENANHNYFNDSLKSDDSNFSYNIDNDTKQLSKEEQQEFLECYVVDFFNYSLKDKIEGSFYDTKVSSINKMYGYDVKNLLTNKQTTSIVDLKNKDNFILDGVDINLTQDALFYKDDLESGINTPIGGNYIRKLLSIKWREKNQSISFVPKFSNFSGFNSLSIDILQDPSDKLNKNIDYQSFSVVLEDKYKNKSIIDLGDNLSSLEKYNGEFEYTDLGDIKIEYWSRHTFISEIKIPLYKFNGVYLSNINKISLLFNKNDTGAIMIENIQLK